MMPTAIILLSVAVVALGASPLWAQQQPFDIAAWVDHFDFAGVQLDGKFLFDTEKPEGNTALLDHVQQTGATTILWRNCAGNTMRYQSAEDAHHNDGQLDKRRVPDNRPMGGWVRYGDAEPDIIRTMVKLCKQRGLRPGIHWPFEETHWRIWTIGRFNLEHPQFWGRSVDGKPWWGRVSLAFEPVVQHKLRLVDELLDRGVECLFLDFRRNGGWGPHVEYVEPLVASYRQKHGEASPADSTDLRWVRHVCENVNTYMRRLRDHVKQLSAQCEIMVGLPNIAPIGDQTIITHLADWRTWVKEGIVDTVVVNNVAWDPKDPMPSTRQLYREVLDFVAGRCRVLMPVMAYDHPYQRGMPGYQKATSRSQEDIAKELALMAWEEGASGLSLECVDFDTYRKPTRDVLKQLRETTCRFARQSQTSLTTHQAPPTTVPASPAPRQPPAGSEPAGGYRQLTDGPGNDTEAAWSPDGKTLVFENNQSVRYKLYRVPVPPVPPMAETREERPVGKPIIEFSFDRRPGATVPDLRSHSNEGKVEGEVAWRDGALAFAPGAFVTLPAAKGCDFGDGAFAVKATVLVREHTNQLRILAVGDYPDNHQGWQLYLADTNHAWFNSRNPQKQYRGSRSDAPLPVGRKVTLVGVRDPFGRVQLYVDGIRQANSSSGATIRYPVPIQVRLGAQFNGKASFTGQLYDFTVYPRALSRPEISDRSLAEFLAR